MKCPGLMTTKKPGLPDNSVPITPFIRIAMYRWYSHWAAPHPGDGTLLFESPFVKVEIFKVEHAGDYYLKLTRWPKGGPNSSEEDWKLVHCEFSTISNSLMLNISDEEVFRGICKPKNN